MNDDTLMQEVEYVGFWPRLMANTVDGILLAIFSAIAMYVLLGFHSPFDGDSEIVLELLFIVIEGLITVAFWMYFSATPGKMLLSAKVVSAKTGKPLTFLHACARYICYIVSALPLGLGFLWIGVDQRKQGFHDKIAGTVVVQVRLPVHFNSKNERLPGADATDDRAR